MLRVLSIFSLYSFKTLAWSALHALLAPNEHLCNLVVPLISSATESISPTRILKSTYIERIEYHFEIEFNYFGRVNVARVVRHAKEHHVGYAKQRYKYQSRPSQFPAQERQQISFHNVKMRHHEKLKEQEHKLTLLVPWQSNAMQWLQTQF